MNFEDAAKQLDPELYERFKKALELGKWPDGRTLTKEQKEICLQTVIVYEDAHDIPEKDRVGYVDTTKKKKKGDDPSDEVPLRVLH
ncbi:hypothetical protein A3715_07295 [Oleiphilus sp. HI0009]|uniref:YeaC family protein n=2 Tax=Oleiphilus TaxID=141450 RepID=UPI0007C2CE39|nr:MULTISPECIES: DUF1315 family protein [unclassified Oleiphilus]KZX81332.1 hypothetical protein A3715_07295 [Oleiphilus sp. HI0009]MCH2159692.1 DUF1315 family protein [Oleiphilaceae bacterium]KZY70788.1 hypothetical protein A3739_05920 [Oleiphilus sp. HI0067]KZY71587.1 hypothetical protein A3738_23660 [Oleiphilus sp. HI0066]KZY72199.1 hypothetical protein A3738_14280 [Oleiphilus sp. HI0066]